MQRQHAEFLVIDLVGGEFAALAISKDEAGVALNRKPEHTAQVDSPSVRVGAMRPMSSGGTTPPRR